MRLRQERGDDYTYALCRATQCPTLPSPSIHTHKLAYTHTHTYMHACIYRHIQKMFSPLILIAARSVSYHGISQEDIYRIRILLIVN